VRGLNAAFFTALTAVLLTSTASANEGQWTPDQIAELDQAELKRIGLELTPEQLWDAKGDEATGGLMRAAVNFGGCSAAFISPEGLIATNHHCAYGALQSNSTPEHDYIENGFLAKTKADELEAKGKTIRVLRKVTDVTGQVREKADAENSDRARAKLIERIGKELIKECEDADPALRCQLASFYNGSQYRLFEYLELRDVRVVYAPPAAVGEYGGEVDNWMWPRHTGDFSLVRAYVGPDGKSAEPAEANVPYKPAQYLRVSPDGVRPDDFVGVLGYPGRTRRYMSAPEVQRWIDQVLPFTVDFNGEWIEILEQLGKEDEAVKIKVAAMKKSLANRHKNARGMLDGLDHMQLLEKRRAEERKLVDWAAEHPEYEGVLDELAKLSNRQRDVHERNVLLGSARRGPQLLGIAIDLVRRARSRQLDDLARPSGYMDRDEVRLWKRQEGRLRDFDARVDTALLASLLARNGKLEEAQRIDPFSKLGRKAGGAKARADFMEVAGKAVDGSRLGDAAEVEKLWKEADPTALAKDADPMLVLANGLVDIIEANEEDDLEREGATARLRPKYFEMLKAVRKGPIYPDANGTLRFSYATVKGYDKWDGQPQEPQTVLAGAVAKHTGKHPFDLPKKVRDAAEAAKKSYWADPALGDLPLCFLSTADTTGGNSGSPVINGKGELVGFNFDRVWENIGGDFAYFDGHSRNITADARYLLWMLDDVDDAGHLLEEIGLAKYRDMGVRDATAATQDAAKAGADTKAEGKAKSGCGCTSAPGPLGAWMLVALAPLLRRRHGS
jgi:uncharacterized protein (TIGR03382 family)